MPGHQPPPEIPKLKRPHYVHDYVDLEYYVQPANFALK